MLREIFCRQWPLVEPGPSSVKAQLRGWIGMQVISQLQVISVILWQWTDAPNLS